MEHSEVGVLTRVRNGGALAVALFALIVTAEAPAHADTIPSPDPTSEVIDQPALPAGPIPSIEPSVPEGTFDPAPTEPVPTAAPIVPLEPPVGKPLESTRPDGTSVTWFRSGDATTSRGTDGGVPRGAAPAPQVLGSEEERTENAPASPAPAVATASPTPVVATASPSPGDARGDSARPGAAVLSTSARDAPAPSLPALILGMAVLVGGLVLMRYRAPVYHAAVRTGGSGERVERLQGPFRLGVVGAVIVLVGVTMNGYAAWQLFNALAS
jgi:hypothetical protein